MSPWLSFAFAIFAVGCTPSIGDKCALSTDCSVSGDRLCDTSQPDGYCTVFNCRGDLCPDQAACVEFQSSLPGCAYTDRSPSRTGRSFCLAQCQSSSDCRSGYVCTDPRQSPWSAVILDDDQTQRVCIVPPDDGVIGDSDAAVTTNDAAVCQAAGPNVSLDGAAAFDAAGDAADAGSLDAGVDAASDAGVGDASDSGG